MLNFWTSSNFDHIGGVGFKFRFDMLQTITKDYQCA